MTTVAFLAVGVAVPGGIGVPLSIIGSLLTSYIDTAFIYPYLFAPESVTPPKLGSIRIQGADEGSPGWRTMGSKVRVPAQVMLLAPFWFEDTMSGGGKRGEVTTRTWYADFALGLPFNEARLAHKLLAENKVVYETVNFLRVPPSGNALEDTDITLDWNKVVVLAEPQLPTRRISAVAAAGGGQSLITVSPNHGMQAPRLGYVRNRVSTVDHVASITQIVNPTQVVMNLAPGLFTPPVTDWDLVGGTRLRQWNLVFENERDPGGKPAQVATIDLSEFRIGNDVVITHAGATPPLPTQCVRAETVDPFGNTRMDVNILGGGILQRRDVPIHSTEGVPSKVLTHYTGIVSAPGATIVLDQTWPNWDPNLIHAGAEFEENFVSGTDDSEISPVIEQHIGKFVTPAFRGLTHWDINGFKASAFGNRVPNFEAILLSNDDLAVDQAILLMVWEGMKDRPQLSKTYDDIRALGFPHLHAIETILSVNPRNDTPLFSLVDAEDVKLGGQILTGFAWSGIYTPAQVLQQILIWYDLSVKDFANKLIFRRRPEEQVVECDPWDLDARAFTDATRSGLALVDSEDPDTPRRVVVQFFNVDNDLQIATEQDIHELPGPHGVRQFSFDIVATREEARGVARRLEREAFQSRFALARPLQLPMKFRHLTPGDVLRVRANSELTNHILGAHPNPIFNQEWRILLTRVEPGADWRVLVEGIIRASKLTITVNPDPGQPPSFEIAPSFLTLPPLVTEVFQLQEPRRESERGKNGYYVAVSPLDPNVSFFGCVIFRSLDSGDTWQQAATITASARMGTVDSFTTLPVPPAPLSDFDAVSTITVSVHRGDLESRETIDVKTQQLNRVLIGNEVLLFADAVLEDDGTYTVSNLLRELLSTSGKGHTPRERFVMLDDPGVAFVELEPHELGKTHLIKAVPFGALLDDVEIAQEFFVSPAGEFRITDLFNVANLTLVNSSDDRVLLEWDEIDSTDISTYEVRRGPFWGGAQVVARVRSPRLVISQPAMGTRQYMVRAQFAGGLYSPRAALISTTVGGPAEIPGALLDLVTSASEDTSGGVEYDVTNKWLQIDESGAELLSGVYTSAEVNLGTVALWDWRLEVDFYEVDDSLISGKQTWSVASSEAHWIGAKTREPSASRPGADFLEDAQDWDEQVSHSRPVYGQEFGSYGRNTWCRVLTRFWDGAAWSSYEPFEPGRRLASKMQVRLELYRLRFEQKIRVTRLEASVLS